MTQTRIPILDLSGEIQALWPQLQQAVEAVMRSGHFIMGANVAAFEKECAAYLGVPHAVACNSGTDALFIGLRALGIGCGDEVITTPFTFVATVEAIKLIGAVPVMVDIDPQTLNIDPQQVAAAVTPRTKAILPVHLFGQAADMDALMAIAQRHGLKVLEDVAQAFGGRYRGRMLGTIGHAAAFSFFPSKNLGAFGDGGLIATADPAVADAARLLRVHGSRRRYHHEAVGYNSRLDEMQAAVLRVKLPHVDQWNAGRRHAACEYHRRLADIPFVRTLTPRPEVQHVYHQYTIRIVGRDRDAVQQAMDQAGISTMIYYPTPVHRFEAYADSRTGPLPHAEEAARQVLSLPIGSNLPQSTIDAVATTLARL